MPSAVMCASFRCRQSTNNVRRESAELAGVRRFATRPDLPHTLPPEWRLVPSRADCEWIVAGLVDGDYDADATAPPKTRGVCSAGLREGASVVTA